MSYLADKITNYILNKGKISDEDYDIYHYGFQTGFELMICLVAGTIIACLLKLFWEFIVVLSVLLPLRAYICGIHMKKFVSCFFCSVVLVTCGPMLVKNMAPSREIVFMLSMGLIFLLHKLSFVTTRYQGDFEEVKFFACQRKKILVCVLLLLGFLFVFNKTGLMRQILYALFVALMSVIGQIVLIKSNKNISECI